MALSFACPGCKTLIQVGEELAGQTGQCPRCEQLLLIPSPQAPVAMLLDAEGKPIPPTPPPPLPSRKPAPTVAPEQDKPRSRRRSVEKKPSGPTWPWAIGIGGAVLVFILLFSSFIALFTYRPRAAHSNLIVVPQKLPNFDVNGVTHGRLNGNVAVMDNGIFRIRGRFADEDINRGAGMDAGFPARRFKIHLNANVRYVLEMESKETSSYLRLENAVGGNIQSIGQHGVKRARIDNPWLQWDGNYTIYISNMERGLSDFTLTVREAAVPAPPDR